MLVVVVGYSVASADWVKTDPQGNTAPGVPVSEGRNPLVVAVVPSMHVVDHVAAKNEDLQCMKQQEAV